MILIIWAKIYIRHINASHDTCKKSVIYQARYKHVNAMHKCKDIYQARSQTCKERQVNASMLPVRDKIYQEKIMVRA